MILEVNGRSLQNLSLLDAHQIFRGLQPGNKTNNNLMPQITEHKIYVDENTGSDIGQTQQCGRV
jgi:hypothetical protein